MSKCKICNNKTATILSFGKMPVANAFLTEVIDNEFLYDLSICFCPACFMVQLENCVKPETMFNENYAFISSTSNAMSKHFEEIAGEIIEITSSMQSPFVVEIGCNDGIMLKHVAKKGINHVGIEPSANVASLARQNGVQTVAAFFTHDTAKEIVKKYGQADVICGANVMCHIEDMNSVFEGVDILLKEEGTLFFEDPYLLDIIKKTSFDQIYDEHIYYFCGLSVSQLTQRHNMQLVDMKPQGVHGGSMRYYIKRGSSNNVTNRVKQYLSQEKDFNLDEFGGYTKFKDNVNKICRDLKNTLLTIKQQGNRIAGYGATSKSATLLNFAQIGPELIDYITDNTPTKVNKYTPGMHIPIKPHDFFVADSPPYTLLLAWNHKEEIFKKEKQYREKIGKFITYFPEVVVE